MPDKLESAVLFQSTLPTRGSDADMNSLKNGENRFQSTLPTRGSDLLIKCWCKALVVSIHAPHEGERLLCIYFTSCKSRFQSTLPTRGSDCFSFHGFALLLRFQSTLPTRGSDTRFAKKSRTLKSFNPRSPRGGATLHEYNAPIHPIYVSIHAPHEGERRRKSAFVCSISANLLNIIHCGTVTRAVSRRRIALFRLFSVRRSGVFMYAYASH